MNGPGERALHRIFRRRARGTAVRAAVAAAAFGIAALAHYVLLAPNDAGPVSTALDAAYAGLQVFSLGADLPIPPEAWGSGGWAPAAVRVTRIAGPLIVTECALFTALMAGVLSRPKVLLQDHLVVLGAGDLGRTLVEYMIEAEPGRRTAVVVVDRNEEVLKELRHLGCWTVQGDAALPAVLLEARVHRARAVVAVTNSDLTNIAAMWNAIDGCAARRGDLPGFPSLEVHVEDADLRRTVEGLRPHVATTRVFNAWDDAALDVVTHARSKGPVALAVVVGYGKLGSAIHRHLRGCPSILVDVDVQCAERAAHSGLPVVDCVVGGIRSAETMQRLAGVIAGRRAGDAAPGRLVVFVATDQEVRNLDMSLRLRDRLRGDGVEVELVTRVLRHPPGAAWVLDGIEIRTIAEMVASRFVSLAAPPSTGVRASVARAVLRFSSAVGAE